MKSVITNENIKITVKTTVNAPLTKVWEYFTDAHHIINWNFASDDWHTPHAENNLYVGGKIKWRMESKDGKMGFDFSGTFVKIEPHFLLEYVIDDGRKVQLNFDYRGNETFVVETFEAENQNSLELQQAGWQAILDNFKKYSEQQVRKEMLRYEVLINAPVNKVYTQMIDEKVYEEWTSAFNASSHFIGNWEKGSRILFVGNDENGKLGGMASVIKENIPNSFICIEHLNIIENGVEVKNAETNEWSGATENYTFIEHNGTTRLLIEMDYVEKYASYFDVTWPKALKILKTICEK